LRQVILSLLAWVPLLGCAQNQQLDTASFEPETVVLDKSHEAVAHLAKMMLGTFSTDEKYAGKPFTDQRILIQDSSQSNEGVVWIYYQLNTGSDRDLYRQRIIKLLPAADTKVIQKTYEPKNPQLWVNAWESPEVVASFTPSDVQPKFEQVCDQIWRAQESEIGEASWRAYISPKTCKIYSQRRKAMISIESESILTASSLKQSERGFDASAEEQLFGSSPNEFITLNRQPQ